MPKTTGLFDDFEHMTPQINVHHERVDVGERGRNFACATTERRSLCRR
jgi:hypothetical protein